MVCDCCVAPVAYLQYGIVGLTAYCIFGLQYIFGILVFFIPKLPDGPRAAVMPYHKYLGVLLFVLTWFAMLTGLMDRERIELNPNFSPPFHMANATGMFIVLSAAVILFHFSPGKTKKQRMGGDMEQSLLPSLTRSIWTSTNNEHELIIWMDSLSALVYNVESSRAAVVAWQRKVKSKLK